MTHDSAPFNHTTRQVLDAQPCAAWFLPPDRAPDGRVVTPKQIRTDTMCVRSLLGSSLLRVVFMSSSRRCVVFAVALASRPVRVSVVGYRYRDFGGSG